MQALSALIADYLETGEYEKQLSPDTIKAYRINLRQFLSFTVGELADKDMLNQYIKCESRFQQNAYERFRRPFHRPQSAEYP